MLNNRYSHALRDSLVYAHSSFSDVSPFGSVLVYFYNNLKLPDLFNSLKCCFYPQLLLTSYWL